MNYFKTFKPLSSEKLLCESSLNHCLYCTSHASQQGRQHHKQYLKEPSAEECPTDVNEVKMTLIICIIYRSVLNVIYAV